MNDLTLEEVEEMKYRIRSIEAEIATGPGWQARCELLMERDELIDDLGAITSQPKRRRRR